MQRIVGIDFGLKRIGLAISDPFLTFAVPLIKIERIKNDEQNVLNLLKNLKDYPNIETFVIGYPYHLSGQTSEMIKHVEAFSAVLERISQKKVAFLDERFTSMQADSLLREREMKRNKRAQVVDILSAALILQTYLDLQSCIKT